MRILSKTATEITRILIHQEDTYITYRKIAGMLDISERSVNTYMKEVSDFCKDKPYQLMRKRGKGICLKAGLYREALLQEIEHWQEPYESRDSRISYIIRTLIESCEPYTAALFSDKLFVSPSTIRTDIEKAAEDMIAYISSIVGRNFKGYPESKFRSGNQRNYNKKCVGLCHQAGNSPAFFILQGISFRTAVINCK